MEIRIDTFDADWIVLENTAPKTIHIKTNGNSNMIMTLKDATELLNALEAVIKSATPIPSNKLY
jgi:hypothetical protein